MSVADELCDGLGQAVPNDRFGDIEEHAIRDERQAECLS
jgi:hypothetical protein